METKKLTPDQRELLQMLVYAREKEAQLSILANALNEPMYKEEYSYLEERASHYDLVFWETLGKLTDDTIDSFIDVYETSADKVEERVSQYRELSGQTPEEK